MCKFFSCIVRKTGTISFCEYNQHEEIIKRTKLKDDSNNFVRIEFNEKDGIKIDELDIPEWFERIFSQIERDVRNIYKKIFPLYRHYNEVEDIAFTEFKKRNSWDGYQAIRLPARENFVKEISKIDGYEWRRE